jgi:hypothetical protein
MDILLWSGFIPRRKEDDQFYILYTTHDPVSELKNASETVDLI